MRKGHPWVIRDRDTGDLSAHRSGDFVDLTDPRGQWLALAIVDPSNPLCARVVSRTPGEEVHGEECQRRLKRALGHRQPILDEEGTTAFRLVHGPGDDLPGLFVDCWGDVLVATRTTASIQGLTPAVYEALLAHFPDHALFEQDHFADLRSGRAPRNAHLDGRWIRKPEATGSPERWTVLERGLRFEVTPLSSLTTGLYPDQRRNRTRLAELIAGQQGGRIANTFAHTGAFSVACAAAGAQEVTSLDLANRYCTWAEMNLKANGLDPEQHPVVQADALSWLERSKSRFDGFVLDPPAHARSRKRRSRGWSLKRDFRALVAAAARRANPSAWILCCVNLKARSRSFLKDQVQAGLRDAKRRAVRLDSAPCGADHPQIRGFPEGRPFEGLLVRLD